MILVEIYVPAMDSQYDFMLDEDSTVEQIIQELSEILAKKVRNVSIEPVHMFSLCSQDQNEILPMQKRLADCSIRDGSRLLLV
jgi:uncharacterized ubiquitin-like protein YukD